jgi:hypothetical protein
MSSAILIRAISAIPSQCYAGHSLTRGLYLLHVHIRRGCRTATATATATVSPSFLYRGFILRCRRLLRRPLALTFSHPPKIADGYLSALSYIWAARYFRYPVQHLTTLKLSRSGRLGY